MRNPDPTLGCWVPWQMVDQARAWMDSRGWDYHVFNYDMFSHPDRADRYWIQVYTGPHAAVLQLRYGV